MVWHSSIHGDGDRLVRTEARLPEEKTGDIVLRLFIVLFAGRVAERQPGDSLHSLVRHKVSDKITRFFGNEFFLSNFYLVDIEYKGDIYPTLEHAYQAAKTHSKKERAKIRNLKYGGEAKKYGRALKERGLQREDWEEVNIKIMRSLLRKKFAKDHVAKLWIRLKNTGDAKLIEGNFWHDRFWGMMKDPDGILRGKNMLGKLLMEIRSELK